MSEITSSFEKAHKDDIRRLVRSREIVGGGLSLSMIAAYFAFMAFFAFDKPALGMILAPGLSVAMIVGPVLLMFSFALCIVYVSWTRRVYDPAVRRLDR